MNTDLVWNMLAGSSNPAERDGSTDAPRAFRKLPTVLFCVLLPVVGVILISSLAAASTAGETHPCVESGIDPAVAACCNSLADPMEREVCLFVSSVYTDGLLTDWPNPRIPGHHDHAPMFEYGDDRPAISESASMLAFYAARIGCEPLFELVFDVSAPAELGGTGAPVSSTRESPYYFASPNLCLMHWKLDADGNKMADDGWLASAAGESVRWLEALSIAEAKFPKPKYRLFANCLARGLIGTTDFDPRAIGHFEDPGTPGAFDDYLMRYYFGWKEDFSDFCTITGTNLSYNNLMGFRYATQPHIFYETDSGAGYTEQFTVPLHVVGSPIRIDMTQRGTQWGYSLYEIEAYGPSTSTNLLLNAECIASSYQNSDTCLNCTCEKALDGNLSTRWSSEQPPYEGGPLASQWIVITPTQTSDVVTITLHWEAAYASSYSLSAPWPFADFYSNVLSYTAPAMTDSVGHCGTPLPRVMYDVERHFYYGEILTPNLAYTGMGNVACAASSHQDDVNCEDCSCEKALDQDLSTRWASGPPWLDDEWIVLTFTNPVTIDAAVLRWETAHAKRYTIDVSNDGVAWTTVYTETNGDGGVDEIHFPLTTTYHVRVHMLEKGTEYGYSLWEFEVYRGGTSSLTALDLARRSGAYAGVSGSTALSDTGRAILDWYKAEYTTHLSVAAAYDPCTGDPLPGGWGNEWPSVYADLAELAAEYGDCAFASRVVREKLCPRYHANPDVPFNGNAFDNLEVLLALRRVDERCGSCACWCWRVYLPLVVRDH